MIDLHRLDIFMRVADEGSFSGAAAQLGMTQSAVSQHMRGLERALGVALFVRGRRGVTLTPEGETLIRYARQVFALIGEAESALAGTSAGPGGTLRLGATPGAGLYLLPDWLQSFSARTPGVSIAIQTSTSARTAADVLARRLDAALIEGEVEVRPSRLGALTLMQPEQFVIIGRPHPWWERGMVRLRDLDGMALAMRPKDSQTRIWLDGVLADHGVRPVVAAEYDQPEAIKRAVSGSKQAAVLPEYVAGHEIALGLLRALPIEDVPLRRDLRLVWDRSRPFSPALRAFLRHLSERFPALATLVSQSLPAK